MEKYVQMQIRLYGPTVIMETVEDVFQLIRLLEESGAGGTARRTINYGSQQRRGPRGTGGRPLTCYGRTQNQSVSAENCETGTGTSKRGQGRCWELWTQKSDCTSCSWGIWKSYQYKWMR
jgi:hypothetical protein